MTRGIRNGDIDHLAIAASGVFVINAKNYTGRIEARAVGGWRTTDRRLFIDNRDRSKLVDGMAKQVDVAQVALESCGLAGTPTYAVLCFTNSEWDMFAKAIIFGDVTCLWARKLRELINQPGRLDADHRAVIARHLSAALPTAE